MSAAVFYVLAAATVTAALGVVLLRNPVHCAMSLVVALFLVSVSYVTLHAHLVAALQIIVYTGAVMVLFLFVIMLLNLQAEEARESHPATKLLGILGAAALAFVLARTLVTSTALAGAAASPTAAPAASSDANGTAAAAQDEATRAVSTQSSSAEAARAEFGTTRGLARVLFREHVIAFELTSLLLLVAVVGAVVLARRERA